MKVLFILSTLATLIALLLQSAPPVSAFGSPLPPPLRPTPPACAPDCREEHHAANGSAAVEVAPWGRVEVRWNPLDVWYQQPPR